MEHVIESGPGPPASAAESSSGPADHWGRFSGFALPHIAAPPNLQIHLALASEGYLNNQSGFDSNSRNVAVEGRGAKSTTHKCQFAMEIRPVASVDALKRRAEYFVLSGYHMNKSAAAQ